MAENPGSTSAEAQSQKMSARPSSDGSKMKISKSFPQGSSKDSSSQDVNAITPVRDDDEITLKDEDEIAPMTEEMPAGQSLERTRTEKNKFRLTSRGWMRDLPSQEVDETTPMRAKTRRLQLRKSLKNIPEIPNTQDEDEDEDEDVKKRSLSWTPSDTFTVKPNPQPQDESEQQALDDTAKNEDDEDEITPAYDWLTLSSTTSTSTDLYSNDRGRTSLEKKKPSLDEDTAEQHKPLLPAVSRSGSEKDADETSRASEEDRHTFLPPMTSKSDFSKEIADELARARREKRPMENPTSSPLDGLGSGPKTAVGEATPMDKTTQTTSMDQTTPVDKTTQTAPVDKSADSSAPERSATSQHQPNPRLEIPDGQETCTICRNPRRIAGIDGPRWNREWKVYLPCGHVFGHSCLFEHIRSTQLILKSKNEDEQRELAQCPRDGCERVLLYKCGHLYIPTKAPPLCGLMWSRCRSCVERSD
ncbi:ring finger domain-containing [Fusarium albosuccineum]|uniref:Ring finger domain-containing n=1 Tax=Fusarium albosuccineum TaxID=1237068 RepID=A0A8H4KJL1_9HYPO|nr:ring finger domain-containing [Fusarium albosuccineum]